ncbi:MAG TPA: methyltransferase [Beutenbergiaceae bacterium]|nr:methyltransferase [Beutenbergiaceae bacterium]
MPHYFSPDADATASRATKKRVTLRTEPFTVTTDRGVFSGEKVDPGTKVLLELVPDPAGAGTAVDVGCGWGPITMALASALPEARVIGVDVNPRAVELTRENLARNGLAGEAHLVEDLLGAEPDLTCDLIWSNPPIRVGKSVLHDIMRTWLPRLSPGGVAYLVVNKNLGGDSLHKWIERELGFEVERVGSRQGFRVLAVTPTS